MICCIIPTYRARETIVAVVRSALRFVDTVIVVDDCCPQHSGEVVAAAFEGIGSVIVLHRDRNGGVGAAVKTGLEKCMELDADIAVKIDADGQMDPANIPAVVGMLEHSPDLGYVKGNRLVKDAVLREMPRMRLFGNAALSLFAKFASGYWNLLDPTNGFVAFKVPMLKIVDWRRFSDSYFFEISVLGELGIRQVAIGELEMQTIYGNEQSSLSIRRVLVEFPPKLAALLWRRVLLQYFLFDVNLGSIYIVLGSFLTMAGLIFGAFEWYETIVTVHARTAGTVMLAVLPTLIGVQLLMNALMYDVQFSPKTLREFWTSAKESQKRFTGRRN